MKKWLMRKGAQGFAEAMAFVRQGAHELTPALQAFPDSNIRHVEEPGIWGNPTPAQVDREANPEVPPDPPKAVKAQTKAEVKENQARASCAAAQSAKQDVRFEMGMGE